MYEVRKVEHKLIDTIPEKLKRKKETVESQIMAIAVVLIKVVNKCPENRVTTLFV